MGLKKLVIELTNLCNLDCEYCFKEPGTSYLSITLLERILQEARMWGASRITYTGGEVSLHPGLGEALRISQKFGYRYSIITNGWHFGRIFPLIDNTRPSLNHVFFSLDSAAAERHDQVRGMGSFARIMAATDICRSHDLPFSFLAVLNQKNYQEIEQLCSLAAQVGATGIRFGHLLPTSEVLDQELSLSVQQRQAAEAEVHAMDSRIDIRVSFATSGFDNSPGACCEAFAGQTVSIDCHGQVSLCCQLASYRGAANQSDRVADLRTTGFAMAYVNFLARAVAQRKRRDQALASGLNFAEYPCDFCAGTMGKTEWRTRAQL